MTSQRVKAQDVMRSLTPEEQAQHHLAWGRCEDLVLSSVGKKAIVYEVHHSVEHARSLYLESLIKGLPSDLCEYEVRKLYIDRAGAQKEQTK